MAKISTKTKIIASVTSVVVVAFAILCCVRWQAWFANPVEPDFLASDTICRVQLTFGNSGQDSRAISWQCGDSVLPAQVQLVSLSSVDTLTLVAHSRVVSSTGGKTVCYWAFADSLEMGRYRYQIVVDEQRSQWYEFDVKPIDKELTFVYLGDVQDTLHGVLRTKLQQIQQRFSPDFWLFGGDVIERPHDQYWNEYFNMVADFCTSTPILAIPGNHEYIKGVNKHLDERFVCVFPYFRAHWRRSVAVYSLLLGNMQLVLLDSNNDLWNLPVEWMWLNNHYNKSAQWHVATMHHPIYSLRGKMNNWCIRHIFANKIDEHCDLVLQGHEHAYARMLHHDTLPLYVVSQCSPKDYHIKFDSLYQRYGIGKRFYQVVQIVGDTLRMRAFTLDDELYDCVTLVKHDGCVQISDDFVGQPESLELVPERYRKSAEKCEVYKAEMEQRRQQTR